MAESKSLLFPCGKGGKSTGAVLFGGMLFQGRGLAGERIVSAILVWQICGTRLYSCVAPSGEMYYHGQRVAVHLEKAIEWLEKGAKLEDLRCQTLLGICLLEKRGVEKALPWFFASAGRADAEGQYYLSYCYLHGEGMPQDKEKGIYLLKQSAMQEYDQAQYELARYYESIGEIKKGLQWYHNAARNNHAEAQYRLGRYYLEQYRPGDKKNLGMAIRYFEKAGSQWHVPARFWAGYCYTLDENYEKAIWWLQYAAKQGSEDAQMLLGRLYLDGLGTVPNMQEGLHWLQKAARRNQVEAMLELGERFSRGQGVPQNYEEAEKWFQRAADRK